MPMAGVSCSGSVVQRAAHHVYLDTLACIPDGNSIRSPGKGACSQPIDRGDFLVKPTYLPRAPATSLTLCCPLPYGPAALDRLHGPAVLRRPLVIGLWWNLKESTLMGRKRLTTVDRLLRASPALAAVVALAGCSPKEDATAPTAAPATATAAPAPVREITQISGEPYRVRNNAHYTVFLVTPEGIVLGDPISTDAATWLKGELAQRFNVPVRYVVYSHHHWDHAAGAAVFNDTAEIVGTRTCPAPSRPTRRG
jgi:hypothetical protein